MYDKLDHQTVIRALDIALMEQAKLWQSVVSGCITTGNVGNVDWTEEFCLLVHNRLDKLSRQGLFRQICQPKSSGGNAADEGLQEIERVVTAASREGE